MARSNLPLLRPVARSKVASVPVGVDAVFLIDELDKIVDVTYGSLEAVHRAAELWQKKTPLKGNLETESQASSGNPSMPIRWSSEPKTAMTSNMRSGRSFFRGEDAFTRRCRDTAAGCREPSGGYRVPAKQKVDDHIGAGIGSQMTKIWLPLPDAVWSTVKFAILFASPESAPLGSALT